MVKGIQIPGFFKNPGIFCRKKPQEECETLREMGNCEMANGNGLKLLS